MKCLLDMNLSPLWADIVAPEGWPAVHWSSVGDARASDAQIMVWAADNGYVVLTFDLDFAALLAATGAEGPSVVQIRSRDASPSHLRPILISALKRSESALLDGAIVSVDDQRSRIRVRPFAQT
jgi:predicted nuclease of predicted toxin-antitoxin system